MISQTVSQMWNRKENVHFLKTKVHHFLSEYLTSENGQHRVGKLIVKGVRRFLALRLAIDLATVWLRLLLSVGGCWMYGDNSLSGHCQRIATSGLIVRTTDIFL